MQPQAYNQDEIVTLTDEDTGASIPVKRKDLPQYDHPVDFQSGADTYAKQVQSGVIGVDSPNIPAKYRTGMLQVLQRNNFNPQSVQDIKDKATATKQKATDAVKKKEALGVTKGTIQNLLDTFQALPVYDKGPVMGRVAGANPTSQAHEYESQRKAMGAALKDIAGAGAGSGVRVTQAELNAWGNLIPAPYKTPDQNKIDIISLDKQLKQKFGEGLDPQYLKQFGAGDSQKKSSYSLEGLQKNAGKDLQGMAQLPEIAVNMINPYKMATDPTYNLRTGVAMGKGLIDTAQEIGQKGIGDYAYNHPVQTAAMVLPPILGAAGAMSGAGEAGVEAGAAEAGAADLAKIPIGEVNPAQNILRQGTDLVKGAGSKEYIARQAANKGLLPQNQILMDENILMHPTETGRIQATARSMQKYGTQLSDAYKQSDQTFTGDEIQTALKKGLEGQGYDSKAINAIVRYFNKQGEFDLAKGDTNLTAEQVWKATQRLEKNPPKMIGSPESAAAMRKLSADAARIARQQLGDKVSKVKPLNAKYAALADYRDSLEDPQGINLKHGILPTIGHFAQDIANPVLNTLYKASTLPTIGR